MHANIPAKNLVSKMTLGLCEAQKKAQTRGQRRQPKGSSGSCHIGLLIQSKETVTLMLCQLMYIERINLIVAFCWNCSGYAGFHTAALVISSSHKVTGIY